MKEKVSEVVSDLETWKVGNQGSYLTSSCGREFGHPKDSVAGRHGLEG